MKTNRIFWIAFALFLGSYSSLLNATIYRGGGGSDGPSWATQDIPDAPARNYYRPAPLTPAQIAEQQAEAARQQRLATAEECNENGLTAYNKEDWTTAAKCFQQALDNNPDNKVYRNNLGEAQSYLAFNFSYRGNWDSALYYFQQAIINCPNSPYVDQWRFQASRASAEVAAIAQQRQRAEEERQRIELARQQDAAVASDMKKYLVQVVKAQPTTPTEARPVSISEFMDSGSGLKDAVADNNPEQRTKRGAFGSQIADPTLEFGDPNASKAFGTDVNAGRQLKAIDSHSSSLRDSSSSPTTDARTAQLGFDTGTKADGSLAYSSTVAGGNPALDINKFSPKAREDVRIRSAFAELAQLQTKRSQQEAELNQITKAATTAKDPETMTALFEKQNEMNKKYQQTLLDISQKEKTAERLHREIDSTVDESATKPAGAKQKTQPPALQFEEK